MKILKRKIEEIKKYILNKKEIPSTQEWINIININENGIIIIKNKIIKIIKVEPINYNLKSELEKQEILNNYKKLFNSINFNIQIIIHSKKQSLDKQIRLLKQNTENIELIEKYINYIKEKNENKNSACKNFYIIFGEDTEEKIEVKINKINEKYLKLKELLSRNENIIKELNKREVIELLNEYLNKER